MQRILLLSVAVVGVWPVAHAADRSLIGKVVQLTPEIPGAPSLYYIGADERRYVFIEKHDEGFDFDTHATWYANRDSVLEASREELESLLIGGVVPLRRGIKLVRQAALPQVYVVEEGGVLREIAEPLLQELYGPAWINHAVTMPDWLFRTQYAVERPYTELVHPDGTLFSYHGSTQVYLLDRGQARSVSPQDMITNGFRAEDVLTIDSKFTYHGGFPLDLYDRDERITTPAGPIKMFNRGDANNDGRIDITDPINMLGTFFRAGPPPTCEDAWDVNDDGQLDISDPVALLLYLFGRFHSQPFHPGPGLLLGYDPTGDDLTCRSYRSELMQIEVLAATILNRAVAPETHDVELARFTFRPDLPRFPAASVVVQESQLKIEILRGIGARARPTDLTNLMLVAPDGSVLAGPVNPTDDNPLSQWNAYGTVVFTDPWRLPSPWVSVRGNIGSAFQMGDVIRIYFRPASVRSPEAVLFGTSYPVGSASLVVRETRLTASVVPEQDRPVVAGIHDIPLVKFSLENFTSAEAIGCTVIMLQLHADEPTPSLQDWRLTYLESPLPLVTQPRLSQLGAGVFLVTFSLASTFRIPPNVSYPLTCLASSQRHGRGTVRGELAGVAAHGLASGTRVPVTVDRRSGPTLRFVTTMNPVVSLLTNPMTPSLVAGGSAIYLGDILVETVGEDCRMEAIELTGRRNNPNLAAGAWDQVTRITISEEGQVVAQTATVSDGSDNDQESRRAVLNFTSPITITSQMSKRLRLDVTIANVAQYRGAENPGKPGQGFQLHLADAAHIHATSSLSGAPLVVAVGGATFAPIIVYRSVPTVWLNHELGDGGVRNGPPLWGLSVDLYRLRVQADPAASLSLRQLVFRVTYRGSEPVDLWLENNQSRFILAHAEPIAVYDGEEGAIVKIYRLTLNDATTAFDAGQQAGYTIEAGQTVTFLLQADNIRFDRGRWGDTSNFYTVELLGDVDSPSAYPAAVQDLPPACDGCSPSGNFVWTDWSLSGDRGFHDDPLHYLQRPQWMNGAKVATADGVLPLRSRAVEMRH